MTKEIRSTNHETASGIEDGFDLYSDFELRASFVIRASCFAFRAAAFATSRPGYV
jgi:hypothetical protein